MITEIRNARASDIEALQAISKATIRANYALGRPVKGQATIAVYPRSKSGSLQPIFSEPLRQVIDISGKVDVEFELAKELRLTDDYAKEIVFDVVVEEEKTQRRQNNSNSLTFSETKDLVKVGSIMDFQS